MPFHYFESKPKWIWIIVTIITSLAMIGGALAIAQSALDNKYADLGKLILSVILFLAGCLFLASLPYYCTVKIQPDIMRDVKSSSKLEIQLLEYPDFTFKLQGRPFEAANVSKFIHDVEENDTISIDITKTDFNQKIKETEPLSFSNKYYHYNYIQVYGLGFNNNHYLSIDEHNRLENEENVWMKWFFIGISLFLAYLFYVEAKEHFKLK